jgi:hypothetical protein
MSSKLLNHHQTRLAEYLSCFNFKIVYYPGKGGGKPDALTRTSGDLPQGGDEHRIEQQKAIPKPQNLFNNLDLSVNVPPSNGQLPLDQEILKAMRTDSFTQKILTMLHEGKQDWWEISLSECQEHDDCLLYQQ